MKPSHAIEGAAARRRARWYMRRAMLRQIMLGMVAPAAALATLEQVAELVVVGRIAGVGSLVGFLAALAGVAIVRWWKAERTVVLARRLYLDTRGIGPLGDRRVEP